MKGTRANILAALAAGLIIPAVQAHSQGHVSGTLNRAEARRILGARFLSAEDGALHTKCGLPVLSAAIEARASLSTEESAALRSLLDRTDRQTSLVSGDGRFRFHFDTTGTNSPALLDALGNRIPGTALAFVDSAVSIMAHVYAYETGTLGYAPPPTDNGLGGGPEYDIYIDDMVDTYGVTVPDDAVPNGGRSSTSIEIDNDFSFVAPDSNRGIPSLRVTLAHEFHHAIQIGSYGFWGTDIWFHEITSTWMEDVVYHGENDYLNYLFSQESQFKTPDLPLTYTFGSIMYSRGILGKYFAKKFGIDLMLHIWQNIRAMAPLQAIDLTFTQIPTPNSTSLGIAFAEWAVWNYYTGPRADSVNYYTEGRRFPLVTETYYHLLSPTQQVTGALACLATSYSGYISGSDTVTVALVNLNIDCPAGAQASSPYTLTVSRNKPDDSYRSIAGNLFLKLDVANPSQWVTWTMSRQGPSGPPTTEGSAYPNPFHPGGGSLLYLPANADVGTLSVFSSGMELVYTASLQTQSRLGQRVFAWDGMTRENVQAPTGVYVFVLSMPGRTVTGKFAVVRR